MRHVPYLEPCKMKSVSIYNIQFDDVAGSCYKNSLRNVHPCVENAMHQNCPICVEVIEHLVFYFLFYSISGWAEQNMFTACTFRRFDNIWISRLFVFRLRLVLVEL